MEAAIVQGWERWLGEDGAFLEYLEGTTLPAVAALQQRARAA